MTGEQTSKFRLLFLTDNHDIARCCKTLHQVAFILFAVADPLKEIVSHADLYLKFVRNSMNVPLIIMLQLPN